MIAMGKIASQHPRDMSPIIMAIFVAEAYPHIAAAGCYYLDVWPIVQPQICVMDPNMVAQYTQEVSLPKAKFIAPEWRPLTNNHDLLTTEGTYWKRWRSAFNPGFSAKNITALLPAFIEEISTLKEIMVQVAKSGETVQFENLARNGTIDIICRAVV
jgi:cytochrome P450